MHRRNTELLPFLQLLKAEFQAPGTKFYALIFEAVGSMSLLLPVVIPEPSE